MAKILTEVIETRTTIRPATKCGSLHDEKPNALEVLIDGEIEGWVIPEAVLKGEIVWWYAPSIGIGNVEPEPARSMKDAIRKCVAKSRPMNS